MHEIRDHTADLAVHIEAATLDMLFAEAAVALFSIIVDRLDDVRTIDQFDFQIDGTEPEFLLVDWRSELLFTFETRRLLFREFQVEVDVSGLSATARGEPFDGGRHELAHEVKAITYHGSAVEQTDRGWWADFIVDI